MANLILYKTKWGSTKLYSEWIAQAAGNTDIFSIDDFDLNDLMKYDKVVIGGMTYMSQISVTNFLKENWTKLSAKPVYLFTVGLVPEDKPDSLKAYELIPEDIRNNLKGHVKLPGKIKVSNLNFLERLVVKAMNGKLADIDKMDKTKIQPIVDFLK